MTAWHKEIGEEARLALRDHFGSMDGIWVEENHAAGTLTIRNTAPGSGYGKAVSIQIEDGINLVKEAQLAQGLSYIRQMINVMDLLEQSLEIEMGTRESDRGILEPDTYLDEINRLWKENR